MQELRRRDDVVIRIVSAHYLPLPLEGSCYEGLRGAMVLVGEVDIMYRPRRRIRIDENSVVPLDEAVPFEI